MVKGKSLALNLTELQQLADHALDTCDILLYQPYCVDLSEAKKTDLDSYDAVIFGSWACAGGISKLAWFKEHMKKWADKKLIVFCVGASPMVSMLF